jgi:hypothetical protein
VVWLLRGGFTLLLIVFGLDTFANVLTDPSRYLAPWIDGLVPGSAHQAMPGVGVVEIAAGLLVAGAARIGGYVVAARLAGIIVNLPGHDPGRRGRSGVPRRRNVDLRARRRGHFCVRPAACGEDAT